MIKSKGAHWFCLSINRNAAVYYDFFWNWIYSTRTIKKPKIKHSLTIYLESKIINLLFVDFIVSLSLNICLQDNLRLHQFTFSKWLWKNDKVIYQYIKEKNGMRSEACVYIKENW